MHENCSQMLHQFVRHPYACMLETNTWSVGTDGTTAAGSFISFRHTEHSEVFQAFHHTRDSEIGGLKLPMIKGANGDAIDALRECCANTQLSQ